jgi:phosphate transporter
MPGGHADLLVMGAAIMCSGAMGLPISGFPNINAVSLEDATGQPYVGTKDFLKVGVPISVIVCLLTVSLGYGTMLLFGL